MLIQPLWKELWMEEVNTRVESGELRNMVKKFFNKISKEFYILTGFVSAYIIYFIYFTFSKHMNFLSGRYDLGNMDQAVWNTLHGRIFTLTNPDFNETMSRLSVHSDFLLILLAPFYAIWDDVRMLLIIQTVVIACGAFFVYGIGRIILKQKLIPLLFAISYLVNPYTNYQNNFDFHAVSLATTFILAAFYFFLRKNTKTFILFVVLSLLTKEHMFFVLGLFGIYLLIFKRKIWGLGIAIVGFLIAYLLIAKFIPEARNGNHFALAYYSDLGGSYGQIVSTFLTNPMKIFSIAIDHELLKYIKFVFMSVGYLSFISPLALIFALPDFVINTLSNNTALRDYYYHYVATIIPFVYISAIYGVKKISLFFKKIKLSWFIVLYISFFGIYSAWHFGPLPGAKRAEYSPFKIIENRDAVLKYLKNVDKSASLAVTNNLGAHLSHRENLYTTTESGVKKADLVLILVDYRSPIFAKYDKELADKLLKDPNFYVDYRIGNFFAFKKHR